LTEKKFFNSNRVLDIDRSWYMTPVVFVIEAAVDYMELRDLEGKPSINEIV
jgi:hypothetical protein